MLTEPKYQALSGAVKAMALTDMEIVAIGQAAILPNQPFRFALGIRFQNQA